MSNKMKNFAGFRPMQCEHCGKTVDSRHYALWHGDNCKTLRDSSEDIDISFDDSHTKLILEFLKYISCYQKYEKKQNDNTARAMRSSLRKLRSLAHDRIEEIHNTRPLKEGQYRITDKIVCEYCGKKSNIQNYKKWHGENCKHKINGIKSKK